MPVYLAGKYPNDKLRGILSGTRNWMASVILPFLSSYNSFGVFPIFLHPVLYYPSSSVSLLPLIDRIRVFSPTFQARRHRKPSFSFMLIYTVFLDGIYHGSNAFRFTLVDGIIGNNKSAVLTAVGHEILGILFNLLRCSGIEK